MLKKALNRSELIEKFAALHGIEPALAERAIKRILQVMTDALSDNERIEIRGFGSFELRYRQPRMARNPKTGDNVQTEGRYAIHFKPGKEMRERANGAPETK